MMLVSSFMTASPVTVGPEQTLQEAMNAILLAGRHLPVVDSHHAVIGILSDRDIRLALNSPLVMRERWEDEMLLTQTHVSDIMSSPVISVEPQAWVSKAAELMLEYEISALPVVDEQQRLVGIITSTDLLRALIHTLEAQINVQFE